MSISSVFKARSAQLLLVGCMAYPAFAEPLIRIEVQPRQVVVQPEPVVVQRVVVQPEPVVVQRVVVEPVVVQQVAVVYEPYPVIEDGVTISIDPEDYYYLDGRTYYHHNYLSDHDVVVRTLPTGQKYLHARIDLSKVSANHFRHAVKRGAEKFEKKDDHKDNRKDGHNDDHKDDHRDQK